MKILAGKYKGKSLKIFSNPSVRPTCGMVKEAVFNICGSWIEGATFLDLFAGIGSVGFEALSRGASSVVFIDVLPRAIQLIRSNAGLLGSHLPVSIIKSDVHKALMKMGKSYQEAFDIIYIDPPYQLEEAYVLRVLEAIVQGNLLAPQGVIFLENSSSKDLVVAGLEIKKQRKFGDTFLTEYQKIQEE